MKLETSKLISLAAVTMVIASALVIVIVDAAERGGLKEPCKTTADCQVQLLCQDDQTCGCSLGHYDGTCLQPIKSEDDECHVDGQCAALFGDHAFCRIRLAGAAGNVSRCACPEKSAFTGDKCELTCAKDGDCPETKPSCVAGGEVDGAAVKVCREKGAGGEGDGESGEKVPNADADADTGDETKKAGSGLSGGAVFGIIVLILIVVVGVGMGWYHRRSLLARFGY